MIEPDMVARCPARQQGPDADILIYGLERPADREWILARQAVQEHLDLEDAR